MQLPDLAQLFGDGMFSQFPARVRDGALEIELPPAEVTDPQAVWCRLNEESGKPGVTGWVCFADGLWWCEGDQHKLPDDLGWVLSAELCHGHSSLHLRQTDPGKWRITGIKRTHQAQPGGRIVEQSFLRSDWREVLRRKPLQSGPPGGFPAVLYEVYWSLSEQTQRLQPVLSRFARFIQEKIDA